ILSVTVDNASNNDTMIEHLSEVIYSFPGAVNQMWCFAHTLNISAKAILKQFDVPKQQEKDVLDVAAQALTELAKDLDTEEQLVQDVQELDDEVEDD
ncbi:hypothetical protein EI94DRAFT_1585149, partial [Lactarius quietus]